MTVLLLTKDTMWCELAGLRAQSAFGAELSWRKGRLGDPLPVSHGGRYEAIVSFVSPWIVPGWLLSETAVALNFHPGSCDFPGIGCYNFALYEGAVRYGAVCHHMLERVDSGEIVREELFDLRDEESVESLKLRTMDAMLGMFGEIVELLRAKKPLPKASRTWQRKPFTRRQLDELGRVTPEMTPEEIRRRVRAMEYPGFPGAFVELGGVRFVAPSPTRSPLA